MKLDEYGIRIAINGWGVTWPEGADDFADMAQKYSDTAELYIVVRKHMELVSSTYEKGKIVKRPNFANTHIRNALKNYENE